jgi:hypothetical protein
MISNLFFRINMPYGFHCNDSGEWMAFNREYLPIGCYDFSMKESILKNKTAYQKLKVHNKYPVFDESTILMLAGSEDSVRRDEKGIIYIFWLYNDGSNPTNIKDKKKVKTTADKYFLKLLILSSIIHLGDISEPNRTQIP